MAKKSVEIFVGTAFPGMMRISKVAGNAKHLLNDFVGMKFGTIVKSNGLEKMRLSRKQGDKGFDNVLGCTIG